MCKHFPHSRCSVIPFNSILWPQSLQRCLLPRRLSRAQSTALQTRPRRTPLPKVLFDIGKASGLQIDGQFGDGQQTGPPKQAKKLRTSKISKKASPAKTTATLKSPATKRTLKSKPLAKSKTKLASTHAKQKIPTKRKKRPRKILLSLAELEVVGSVRDFVALCHQKDSRLQVLNDEAKLMRKIWTVQ